MAFSDRVLVSPGFWIGSAPEPGSDIRGSGFQVLVLCADEYQIPAREFQNPGLTMHVPLDDSGPPPTLEEVERARDASRVCAGQILHGANTLFTCRQGRNRSGWVLALTYRLVHRVTGHEARVLVQQKRRHALTNRYFVAYLDSLGVPQL
jgi:hypothetical protein